MTTRNFQRTIKKNDACMKRDKTVQGKIIGMKVFKYLLFIHFILLFLRHWFPLLINF